MRVIQAGTAVCMAITLSPLLLLEPHLYLIMAYIKLRKFASDTGKLTAMGVYILGCVMESG